MEKPPKLVLVLSHPICGLVRDRWKSVFWLSISLVCTVYVFLPPSYTSHTISQTTPKKRSKMNIERQKNVHLDDVPNIMSQINHVISLTSSSVEAPNTYILVIYSLS
ncbi:hypothetical protein ACN38_g3372 [Penicillium nordicum]|uniref:Uncharacterized protein n=1 Tax=Penicillium nordicum TaxID=229535 RepID=A0A0M8P586_9EURO|nr:hypothetical protein ACN38_g3372 [Penicillium nordicum]